MEDFLAMIRLLSDPKALEEKVLKLKTAMEGIKKEYDENLRVRREAEEFYKKSQATNASAATMRDNAAADLAKAQSLRDEAQAKTEALEGRAHIIEQTELKLRSRESALNQRERALADAERSLKEQQIEVSEKQKELEKKLLRLKEVTS